MAVVLQFQLLEEGLADAFVRPQFAAHPANVDNVQTGQIFRDFANLDAETHLVANVDTWVALINDDGRVSRTRVRVVGGRRVLGRFAHQNSANMAVTIGHGARATRWRRGW